MIMVVMIMIIVGSGGKNGTFLTWFRFEAPLMIIVKACDFSMNMIMIMITSWLDYDYEIIQPALKI